MQVTLQAFLQRMIRKYEGGWVWDKNDPGGPTNYGVTWIALADHRKEPANSASDWAPKVKAMGISEAIQIYEKKYAPPVHYAALPAGVDTTMLDYGVNSGPGRANRVARRIVGMPDGTRMTDEVVAKIRAMSPSDFINKMNDERLAFMKSLKGGAMWQRYGKGWGTRVSDLRSYSLALASGKVVPQPAPDLSKVPTPKAQVEKPSKKVETSSSGIGGAIASAIAYFTDLPWLYIGAGVGTIFAISIAVGVYRELKSRAAAAKVHI